MKLEKIINDLKNTSLDSYSSLMDPLPSNLRLKNHNKISPRYSAVLLVLFEKDNQTHSILTQRHEYEGAHSGQISLPGGKQEVSDTSLKHTALRETEEEIGIPQININVISKLKDLYIPPSNFLVTPYVATLDSPPLYTPDNHEVKEIIEFPVSRLFESDVIKQKNMNFNSENSIDVKYFDIKNKVVWGATAMILENFINRIS